jgi:hypothetical protein
MRLLGEIWISKNKTLEYFDPRIRCLRQGESEDVPSLLLHSILHPTLRPLYYNSVCIPALLLTATTCAFPLFIDPFVDKKVFCQGKTQLSTSAD